MKTPEQIAAETAKEFCTYTRQVDSTEERLTSLILAALTEHAAKTQAELTAIRAVADDLEDALLTCSPMADYPSEEWTRLSEKRISALTSYTKLRIGEKGAV